ncbi:hypothetical protein [Hyphomicrobium sp.]|uniref:hypothetical protein n=1 Tax=Hyphomicrobium sp. TaxID=82 RepID=UPI002D1FBD45|nr:hypothetical protein [Hyphomicrobium sp.]
MVAAASSVLAGQADKPQSTAFNALPKDVRAFVDDVRQHCDYLLKEMPEQERADQTYVPEDGMSGILSVKLGGRPAIVVDNFKLCTTDVIGGNCTNAGCDLTIWLQHRDGTWRKTLTEHLQAPPVFHIDGGSGELLLLDIFPQEHHPECSEVSDKEEGSDNEFCNLRAEYREGKWAFKVFLKPIP